jgi:hypothetical protein
MRKLAAFADIPAASLHSTEGGRRSFNPEMQQRLRRRGLDWDQKEGKWYFTFDHGATLSLSLLEAFRRLSSGGSPLFQDVDAHMATWRVIALMQQVEPSRYRDLLLDINDALENLRVVYKVDDEQKVFAQTELRYRLVKTKSGGETLSKNYSWPAPPDPRQLLDHSKLRLSSVYIDEERDEEVQESEDRPARPAA